MLLFAVVAGSRFTLRSLFHSKQVSENRPLAVYGAGAAGARIVQSLKNSPGYTVRLLIDDNPKLQGQFIYGLKVLSLEAALEVFEQLRIDIILLAIPSATFSQRQKIINQANQHRITIKTIPAIADIIGGKAEITEFKDIAIEDLLGRDSVAPLIELMGENIFGNSVLVTGAGGSIGNELSRQILELQPKKLLVLDLSEAAIYAILQELEPHATALNVEIVALVGAVQDRAYIRDILITQR